ncbi:DNA repair protein RadA [Nesterenkonia alkaliphila]|uniref:DNA repair protein RadA n=1 Tax=Nesterenkonia alkaliphila TaxID=1463631 RepID=A0A7K1UIR7_9MICC|nr:DNA repair protein RadA [Nesterenkonia alkaliphila]MVT26262.1 DNA repair protein RadA [Nesterenkonia alkaliphila]GFZ91733.1 DNA repair protein RadA [Nesterenkonia alkaliphila]
MVKKKSSPGFECTECGWQTVKWVGRCAECQSWGTVAEKGAVKASTTPSRNLTAPAQTIAEVDSSVAEFRPTGIGELDRVLGGGLVPGAVILMAGEPGVGKSTLLLQTASAVASKHTSQPVLYLTGEESAAQVKKRAERTDALAQGLYLAAESDLGQALGQIEEVGPQLTIMDSVQTLSSAEIDGAAGGVTQIREVTAAMIEAAKRRNMTTILVGHVTKDGSIAGPRMLEHLVDVVCQFEGDRHSRLRLLRAVKNRYGPTDDVGCFDLSENGLESLADPSGLFISATTERVPGTCITITLEGRRPLTAEVQALVAESQAAQPRRAVSGLDSPRVSMLLAVLQRRAKLQALMKSEAYVSTVGGVKITEPAADLAVALAVASAALEKPLPSKFLAFGEVGLAGEVRPVAGIKRRLQEAARLGFTHAIVPRGAGEDAPEGIRIREIGSLPEALELILG